MIIHDLCEVGDIPAIVSLLNLDPKVVFERNNENLLAREVARDVKNFDLMLMLREKEEELLLVEALI